MVKLRQDSTGKYLARKRLPDDVREEYGRRYKAHHEAKFSAPASDGPHVAKQRFREWDAEVTARIEAIRAERKGEGISLTRQQARALAGEWYHWFIARHPTTDLEQWDAVRERVHEALREAVGAAEWERSDPDELWPENAKLRKEVYPVLADVGETAQFLAMKRLTLNAEGRESFLYWLYDDLAAVLKKLERLAKGDYGDDGYAKRFPKFEGSDSGDTADKAARRWVSWLCAYTGARPGEITQLRGADVVQQDGIWALRITPEAGTVKGRESRTVPLHEHLIEQGFLKFVDQSGPGPLFYNPHAHRRQDQLTKKKKPRSVQARQRLADWVRSLGVGGRGLSPLHGWRHTFKRLAARAGIEAGMRDAICGHSPRTVADEYETPSLGDMAAAMKKFPRYVLA
jgi:integrase